MATTQATAGWDPLHLLARVREVASYVNEQDVTAVTQRPFDGARSRRRFADLPPARRICERLQLRWKQVLNLAAMSPDSRAMAYGQLVRESDQREWLRLEYVDFVLGLVARRLGVETFKPWQYMAERDRMLQEDRTRWLHGGQLRLPTEHQIAGLCGSWDVALAQAGLARRMTTGNGRLAAGPTIPEIIDRCYEAHGTQPTNKEVVVFARANGIPYPGLHGRPWGSCVEEWKDGRRARGLAVPVGPPPQAERPDYAVDVGAALPGERRQERQVYRLDGCVDAVARYLAQLPPGSRSTQRGYNDWARTQPDVPWASTFRLHGGWARVRELAWERLRGGAATAVRARQLPSRARR